MKYTDEEREIHTQFMKQILLNIASKNYPTYLKGGTALYLCHGLDRFSEDIDLNSEKKFNLETTIKEAALKANIHIADINIPKNTDTTKRYKVKYFTDAHKNEKTLKIETSYRDKIKDSEIGSFNGINAYNVESMVKMKLSAIKNRTKARDLYDIIFLADRYSDCFSAENMIAFIDLASNIDKLASYEDDYLEDYILKDKFDENILDLEVFSSSFKNKIEKNKVKSVLDNKTSKNKQPYTKRKP